MFFRTIIGLCHAHANFVFCKLWTAPAGTWPVYTCEQLSSHGAQVFNLKDVVSLPKKYIYIEYVHIGLQYIYI